MTKQLEDRFPEDENECVYKYRAMTDINADSTCKTCTDERRFHCTDYQPLRRYLRNQFAGE